MLKAQEVNTDSIAILRADSLATEKELGEVVVQAKQILGSKFQARNRTGSAYYISPNELKKFDYTDINRMLKSVPGVNMYEEDGFGLRPNISLRGTKAERSERITIMEDGILASPAPYSSPAAYYFPNAARMSAVEVLKGSSQVQYGPFTTGGAINMVSTPIPDKFKVKLSGSYGSFNTFKGHATLGASLPYIGYLVEYLYLGSDGFKQFTPKRPAGIGRHDVLAKLRFNNASDSDQKHSFELKFGFANEKSHESYTGLSEDDFNASPFLRYAGSQKDNMASQHQQWAATYQFEMGAFRVIAQAYYNKFHRNWYKLQEIRAGHTKEETRNLGEILDEPEINKTYFDILTGKTDYIGDGLILRANNRNYFASGVQSRLFWRWRWHDLYSDIEAGIRYHVDQEDRFQWDDSYSIVGGEMQLFRPGIPGEQANRINNARALASHLLGKVSWRWVTTTIGLRYENINLHQNNMGKHDPRRTGHSRIDSYNHAKVLIPSLGINVKPLHWVSAFVGVHKGFSPPSVTEYPPYVAHRSLIPEGGWQQQRAEESVNIEGGVRFHTNIFQAEVIGFCNHYSHMLGSDLTAAGGLGTLEQFNIGEAVVQGLECLVHVDPFKHISHWRLPIQLTYTLTDTEMRNNFLSSAWGKVDKGDEIPYIYRHAVNLSLGIEWSKWGDIQFSARYNSAMRTRPGQGVIANHEKVPAHLIFDASCHIFIHPRITFSVNALNLTNQVYLTSRHPFGLRPGHPFGIYSGLQIEL